jgi:arsenate reductase
MVLFVCHGNVARSQFAEAILRNLGISDVQSAGTHVDDTRQGNRLLDDGETAQKAVKFFKEITGMDISHKTRKKITPELAEDADIIIVMTEKKNLPSYVHNYKEKLLFWKIEDPHDMDVNGYRLIIKKINAKIDELKSKLGLPVD